MGHIGSVESVYGSYYPQPAGHQSHRPLVSKLSPTNMQLTGDNAETANLLGFTNFVLLWTMTGALHLSFECMP